MTRSRNDAFLLVLLAALPLLAYAPALRAERLLGPGDGAELHFPLRSAVWDSYRSGDLPSTKRDASCPETIGVSDVCAGRRHATPPGPGT